MSVRHFLTLSDLSGGELRKVLRCAMASPAQAQPVLQGKSLVLIFEKPSVRTRHSMEMATSQLGGHSLLVLPGEIQLGVREKTSDISRTLARYHNIAALRVFKHEDLEEYAQHSVIPVVNMLSDRAHPLQALADLMTMMQEWGMQEWGMQEWGQQKGNQQGREMTESPSHFPQPGTPQSPSNSSRGATHPPASDFAGRSVAYIGAPNNVSKSLALACAAFGLEFRIACPSGYEFHEQDYANIKRVAEGNRVKSQLTQDPIQAVSGADVVYTDVWASMGEEDEASQRKQDFADYAVTEELMSHASPAAIFLHCLPAHRGEEVTEAVLEGKQSRVWRQAENRMHTARGLLWWLAEVN